ncbi:MAG: hypothetical protein ACYDHG_17585 [Desulfomonilaceae bacterium]
MFKEGVYKINVENRFLTLLICHDLTGNRQKISAGSISQRRSQETAKNRPGGCFKNQFDACKTILTKF